MNKNDRKRIEAEILTRKLEFSRNQEAMKFLEIENHRLSGAVEALGEVLKNLYPAKKEK